MLLTQLDMPAARYVCYANEGFISYRIDVRKANGNISSLSVAKAYRVNEVDISTEEKREQEYKEKLRIFLLFLFVIRVWALLEAFVLRCETCNKTEGKSII